MLIVEEYKYVICRLEGPSWDKPTVYVTVRKTEGTVFLNTDQEKDGGQSK